MSNKFFIYALFVTVASTWTSWAGMFKASTNSGRGSSWSSNSGYYGGGTGGGGGGGHK
ncbi:MAG: hypothetical protein V4508_22050 [Pseudomonadota bacterium]